jgi:hypothetical protein
MAKLITFLEVVPTENPGGFTNVTLLPLRSKLAQYQFAGDTLRAHDCGFTSAGSTLCRSCGESTAWRNALVLVRPDGGASQRLAERGQGVVGA